MRKGFTLVELIVVIAVVGVLVSLLLPALASARRAAKVGAMRAELSNMDTALATFYTRYGSYPPSGIVLCERGADWDWKTMGRDMGTIRRLWPQFDFTKDRDLNRDGQVSGQVTLDGPECLALFLGGVYDKTVQKPIGFCNDPLDPFRITSGTRSGPFIELDASRFSDKDGDGQWEYRGSADPESDPIVYYSAYSGAGYQSRDAYVQFQPYRPGVKLDSYQLISPGLDGLLGDGGQFDPRNPEASLAVGRPTSTNSANCRGKAEWDNLANFARGELRLLSGG